MVRYTEVWSVLVAAAVAGMAAQTFGFRFLMVLVYSGLSGIHLASCILMLARYRALGKKSAMIPAHVVYNAAKSTAFALLAVFSVGSPALDIDRYGWVLAWAWLIAGWSTVRLMTRGMVLTFVEHK